MLDTLLTGPGKHFTRAITTYHVTRTWVTTLHEWTNLDRRIVANSQSPPSKCCWYSNLRKKFERTMASVTVRSKNFLPPRLAVEKVWFSRNLSETGYEITESCRNSQSCCVITSLFDTNRDNFEVSVKFFIQKHSAIFRTASASLSNTGAEESLQVTDACSRLSFALVWKSKCGVSMRRSCVIQCSKQSPDMIDQSTKNAKSNDNSTIVPYRKQVTGGRLWFLFWLIFKAVFRWSTDSMLVLTVKRQIENIFIGDSPRM